MEAFMSYIRNQKDAKNSLTADEHLAFLKSTRDRHRLLKAQQVLNIQKSNKNESE
jgi:hypothetical protein